MSARKRPVFSSAWSGTVNGIGDRIAAFAHVLDCQYDGLARIRQRFLSRLALAVAARTCWYYGNVAACGGSRMTWYPACSTLLVCPAPRRGAIVRVRSVQNLGGIEDLTATSEPLSDPDERPLAARDCRPRAAPSCGIVATGTRRCSARDGFYGLGFVDCSWPAAARRTPLTAAAPVPARAALVTRTLAAQVRERTPAAHTTAAARAAVRRAAVPRTAAAA